VEKLERLAGMESDFEDVISEMLFPDGGEGVGITQEERGRIHCYWEGENVLLYLRRREG